MVNKKERVLEIEKLNFSYGETSVLSDISFSIYEGDFLGVVGPNGSGKTTLLRLILGLNKLSDGNIKILNQSIKNFKDWCMIGYVPQKVTNFDSNYPASVKEIVSMGIRKKGLFSINSKKKESLIKTALKVVDMTEFQDRRIGELSGGQQQRIFIARAIVNNPKILFLDEPTTGIDQESKIKFYELLHSLNKKGITIVLISHDISRITKYVTKVANLDGGLTFYSKHKEFCHNDQHHHDSDTKCCDGKTCIENKECDHNCEDCDDLEHELCLCKD